MISFDLACLSIKSHYFLNEPIFKNFDIQGRDHVAHHKLNQYDELDCFMILVHHRSEFIDRKWFTSDDWANKILLSLAHLYISVKKGSVVVGWDKQLGIFPNVCDSKFSAQIHLGMYSFLVLDYCPSLTTRLKRLMNSLEIDEDLKDPLA